MTAYVFGCSLVFVGLGAMVDRVSGEEYEQDECFDWYLSARTTTCTCCSLERESVLMRLLHPSAFVQVFVPSSAI
jgi:hypothetical protein